MTTFETEFVVAVSVNGGPFVLLPDPVASSTSAGTGMQYIYTSPKIPGGLSLRFKVKARNVRTGQESSFSEPLAQCSTPTLPPQNSTKVKGQVSLQGRSNHQGTWVYFDRFPVTQTDSGGHFRIDGAPLGLHELSLHMACYLREVSTPQTLRAGQWLMMPAVSLFGGDINGDGVINLFDLVRVGADYRSSPPTDPTADCNADGSVNLFDLVMVSANYRMQGPLPWGYQRPAGTGGEPSIDTGGGEPRNETDVRRMEQRALARNPAEAHALRRPAAPDAGERVLVEIAGRDLKGLYAAELSLAVDPARARLIDADPAAAGLQALPGEVWAGGAVAQNRVEGAATLRFAASRLKPSGPVSGDAVLLRVMLHMAPGTDPATALRLIDARLVDRAGKTLEEPAGVWRLEPRRLERRFLPYAGAGSGDSAASEVSSDG